MHVFCFPIHTNFHPNLEIILQKQLVIKQTSDFSFVSEDSRQLNRISLEFCSR